MARGLKTLGMEELEAFKLRIRRQFAWNRISQQDHDKLIELVENMEGIISSMDEKPDEEARA